MFKKLAPISTDAHANIKVSALNSFEFASQIHMAAVSVSEFPRAASSYPIVFVKAPEGEEYKPVALMGLKEGENNYINDGKWDAPYVPAIIRRYPFGVATLTEKEGEFAICVDEESPAVSTEGEGQALFEDGKATKYLEGVRDFLTDMQKQEFITKRFSELLVKHDLLIAQTLEVKDAKGETKRIGGFYLLNEPKFRELPDQTFLEFRHKGALDAIYSQLASLAQVQRLVAQSQKADVAA